MIFEKSPHHGGDENTNNGFLRKAILHPARDWVTGFIGEGVCPGTGVPKADSREKVTRVPSQREKCTMKSAV